MAVKSSVKSIDHQVKEYVKKITEDDLRWLSVRFKERVGADLAEALLLIQERYSELNRLLTNTPNSDAVFNVADVIDKYVTEEIKRRSSFRPKETKEKVETKDKTKE
jgi:hypothetical protein